MKFKILSHKPLRLSPQAEYYSHEIESEADGWAANRAVETLQEQGHRIVAVMPVREALQPRPEYPTYPNHLDRRR